MTAFNGQGEMLRILLKQPESDADRDNTVRVVVGAAAATDLVEQFEQRYDLAVLDAYGMTETGPTIAASWERAARGRRRAADAVVRGEGRRRRRRRGPGRASPARSSCARSSRS